MDKFDEIMPMIDLSPLCPQRDTAADAPDEDFECLPGFFHGRKPASGPVPGERRHGQNCPDIRR